MSDWSKTCHLTEYYLAKTAECLRKFHNFQTCGCCEKDFKDNKLYRNGNAMQYSLNVMYCNFVHCTAEDIVMMYYAIIVSNVSIVDK